MCGLVGLVDNTAFGKYDYEKFFRLTILSTFRGFHSTGVVTLNREKNKIQSVYQKALGDPFKFWDNRKIAENLERPITKAMLGHTRLATKGEITKKNAHPFQHGDWIGMHNGTLNGTFEFSKDFETDSEALVYLISQKGIKEALNIVEKDCFNKAYALVLFNTQEGKLYFLRNNERPLHCLKVGCSLVYASEKRMLEFLYHNTKNPDIRYFKTNSLYSIDFNKEPKHIISSFKIEEEDFVEIKTRWYMIPRTGGDKSNSDSTFPQGQKVKHTPFSEEWETWGREKFPEFARRESTGDSGNSENRLLQSRNNSKRTEEEDSKRCSPLIKKTKEKDKEDVNQQVQKNERNRSDEFHIGYNNNLVATKVYENRLNQGCAWCSAKSDIEEDVDWLYHDVYLCEDCKSNTECLTFLKEYYGNAYSIQSNWRV